MVANGSGKRPNTLLSLIAWLLPSSGFKTWALRRLGNTIGRDVSLAPCFVLGCGRFSIGDGSGISAFNVFRNLARVELAADAHIGSWNQITAAPDYQRFSDRVGVLWMGAHSIITNRHYFDCSGQIVLRDGAGIGGIKSIFQSHEIDLLENKTTIGVIVIGSNAMTGTNCTVLKDAVLPDRSILGAGSLLAKAGSGAEQPEQALYGGVPARFLRELDGITWWDRDNYYTPVEPFDDGKFLAL